MRAAFFLLALLAVPIAAEQAAQQAAQPPAQPPAQQPTPQTETRYTHALLAQGIAASAPMTVPLRTVPGQIVLRNFVVGRGTAKDVANPEFSVMELRAGHVFTTIAGDRQERVPGDFWTVDKGATITFENPEPHSAAVIRVTSFGTNR
ncbi:MAG TPA: hypothetical protein VEL51_21170 [Vicinamibacterales bacterium]|nr:hypothetical protein [Vicinamibacterales bacterium]